MELVPVEIEPLERGHDERAVDAAIRQGPIERPQGHDSRESDTTSPVR